MFGTLLSLKRTLDMLYDSFLVIPRRLNCICRRFGTLCSIFIPAYEDGTENFYILLTVHLEVILDNNQLNALFLNVFISCLTLRKSALSWLLSRMEQRVLKRRHVKFRRRGITQNKSYNIQNTAEV